MTSMQSLSALFKPPTFKGKKEHFVPWKIKFTTFLGTLGCAIALQDSFEKSLPATGEDVSTLDETDPADKAFITAVKHNATAMQAIIMALEMEDDVNTVIVEQMRDAMWPNGKAYKVWKRLEDEYQPADTTSKVEMTRAIKAITLEAGENPKSLLSKMARIEATYRTAITEDERRAIVWEAAAGQSYGAMMLMTDERIKASTSKSATAEELVEVMYRVYRMDESPKNKAPEGAGETSLAATGGGGSFKGKCFACNKTGHRKVDCPTKAKSEKAAAAVGGKSSGGKERYNGNCGFCDKKGHREADCWKKYPEKKPGGNKDDAAAVTVDELLVCSLDGFSDVSAEVVTCQEVSADAIEVEGDGAKKYLEARLLAILNDPTVFIYGEGRAADKVQGLPTVAKAGAMGPTTSTFSDTCSPWNLDEKPADLKLASTWKDRIEFASTCNEGHSPEAKNDNEFVEEPDEEIDTTATAVECWEAAITNECQELESMEAMDPLDNAVLQPRWVWKASKDTAKPRKSWRLKLNDDGTLERVHEKLVLEGAPSEETSVWDADDGTFTVDDEGVENGWWGTYYCWELCMAAQYAAQLSFPNNEKMLRSPHIWIGDTGASMHVTFSKLGCVNLRASDSQTRGVSGEAMRINGVMDIPSIKCDKHGNEEFPLTLTDVNYLENSNYNLFSVTKLLSQGWTMAGSASSMVLTRGDRALRFDIVVRTRSGVVFCACLKRVEEIKGKEISGAALCGSTGNKLSIAKAHALLGHCNEAATRRIAKHLDWTISRGTLPPCESCATGKAQQKNVPTVSEHVKAVVPNGRLFHDQSTLKPPDGVTCYLKVWNMTVDEYCGMKVSNFYKTKNAFIEPLCEKLQKWKNKGVPVLVIRQDNAGENKALQARVQSADWKLDVTFEYTAPYTPQQNSLVERAFAEIASKARAMMNAANVPYEYRWRLFPVAADTAVKLDWLQVIERDGVMKSRIEFYGFELPRFAKHLRTWGEAGTVKIPKDGKVKARGITCVFIGYASDHEGNCYRMWNPETGRVILSRDVTFLQRMFFEKANTDATKQEPVVFIPVDNASAVGDSEENAEMELIGVKTMSTSREGDDDGSTTRARTVSFADTVEETSEEENGNEGEEDGFTIVTAPKMTRSGRTVKPPTRLIEEMSGVASIQNYYACLEEYEPEEVVLMTEVSNAMVEIAAVGAGLGGGFDNTQELRVMKYEEAINGPDGKAWEAEVDKEHGRMVKNKAWVAVDKADLPPGTIPIDSTWAMKKKSNGTLRGRLNARGFKQIEGVHYDGSSIHAPVTNSATIRIVLVLMLMAMWMGILLDVNGAFLHGEFTDGERIYMKVPKGMEKHYPPNVVLLLLKCIYGLKQAAMAFWKRLLICMRSMGFERSMSDPCLYYKWTENNGLVIIISWIDDNLIVGSKAAVQEAKKAMMERFECDDCGEIEEYVGCKIVRDGRELKFTQPVLLQSFTDEFELPERDAATPAVPGSVLPKVEKGKELSGARQTKYRSGVGKLMHMMQYSRPEIYNSVRDLARHMTMAGEEHFEAMLRVMKYCVNTADRGLVLKPEGEWDGKPDSIEFIISGRSDSDYAKDPSRKSVSGHRVLLNGAPVMFKSGTQRIVALSVCEAELYAGISCAQDMLYVKHVIESLGLKVKLPMKLEIDNKGAVDLANNWSIGGRTRHIGTKIEFLRLHKENGVIEVVWMPGSDNDADMFTKNLGGPLFRRFAQVFVGKDKYLPASAPE